MPRSMAKKTKDIFFCGNKIFTLIQNNGKYKLVAENNQGKIIKLEKALENEYRLR